MAARPLRLTPLLVAALSLAALLALVVGGRWGEAAFAAVSALFPGALIAFAARRRGRLGGAAGCTAVALSAVLAASFALLFALTGGSFAGLGPGLPSLAVLLAGVWLVPLVFVGFAYAFDFAANGVSADDLERLRALRRGAEAAPRRDG